MSLLCPHRPGSRAAWPVTLSVCTGAGGSPAGGWQELCPQGPQGKEDPPPEGADAAGISPRPAKGTGWVDASFFT